MVLFWFITFSLEKKDDLVDSFICKDDLTQVSSEAFATVSTV